MEKRTEASHQEALQVFLDDSGFYYSLPAFDLSRSSQARYHARRQCTSPEQVLLPDERFHWNRHISGAFLHHKQSGWVTPVIDGFISVTDVQTSDGVVTYAMISRRGCQRAGARYYVRGADPLGNVANFAETEQLVVKEHVISSFVQVRGSIPMLWTQKAKGYASPKPQIIPSIFARAAFQRHFEKLFRGFPGINAVAVISLIDQSGNEGDLADEFATQIKLLGYPVETLRFIAWDFHEECRGNQFENVDRLVAMLADDLESHSYFMIDDLNRAAGPAMEQSGLVRTNC